MNCGFGGGGVCEGERTWEGLKRGGGRCGFTCFSPPLPLHSPPSFSTPHWTSPTFFWRWFAAVFKIHPWFHASVRNKCSRSYWGVQTRGSNKRLFYTGRTVCPLVVVFVYYVTQVTDGRHSEYNQGLISITKHVKVNNDINNEKKL